jgi:hypothetical protein
MDRIVKYREIEERLKFHEKHKSLPLYEQTSEYNAEDVRYQMELLYTNDFVTPNEAKKKILEVKDKFLVNGQLN